MNRCHLLIGTKWAHQRKIYGKNIGIAVIDTGIHPHIDLTSGGNRIIGFQDMIQKKEVPYDDNGHGTHVAGIIAGNGTSSNQKYIGMAPKSNLIGIKVLNQDGNGSIPHILSGFQWIIQQKETYQIRIVNISIGATSFQMPTENSALIKGVNQLWDAGLIVVAAAGNNGPKPGSVSSPGISRKIITVGACDDAVPIELSGTSAKHYSGRGPTYACIQKPDLVAPGSHIFSCQPTINSNYANPYTYRSGTSMSTPIVSGAIALLLSIAPSLTNKEVKIKLKESCIDLGLPKNQQGWGLIHIPKLLS